MFKKVVPPSYIVITQLSWKKQTHQNFHVLRNLVKDEKVKLVHCGT